MLPECSHSFCIHCIINWTFLQRSCPLCKSTFNSLLIQRDLETGQILTLSSTNSTDIGWIESSLTALQNADWIKVQLQHINTKQQDVLLSTFQYESVQLTQDEEDDEVEEDDDWLDEQEYWERRSGMNSYKMKVKINQRSHADVINGLSTCTDLQGKSHKNTKRVILGNRPLGNHGYVKDGRRNARPSHSSSSHAASSSSSKRQQHNNQ